MPNMYQLKRGKSPMREHSSTDSMEELDSLLRQTTGGRPGGLGVVVMMMFIMGQSSGSGILALPLTIEQTGPIGFVLLIVCGVTAGYTGILLGKCWLICERRYPELLKHTSDPYATIGEKACGVVGRSLVLIANNMTIYLCCVVYVLLASGLISDVTAILAPSRVPTCLLALIFGGVMIPLGWLGTPVDFWPVSFMASLTTIISCVLISLNMGKIYWSHQSPELVQHPHIKLAPFFVSIGTIMFSFSGHMAYPTLQQDMKRRKDFWKTIIMAFSIIFSIYFLVTVTSYFVLGRVVSANILTTVGAMSPGWMAVTPQILIVLHLLSGYLTLFNPLCQDAEKLFHIPNKPSLGRVVVRTVLLLSIVFVALSVPKFNAIMSLVGGSALGLTTYVLPVIFYECLCRRKGDWPSIPIPVYITVLHVEIVVVSTVLGLGATVASLDTILAPDTFVMPCYINLTAADT